MRKKGEQVLLQCSQCGKNVVMHIEGKPLFAKCCECGNTWFMDTANGWTFPAKFELVDAGHDKMSIKATTSAEGTGVELAITRSGKETKHV